MDRATEILQEAKSVAVVGISSQPERASNQIARHLIEQGFEVYLVNPRETEVLGQPVYASVRDLPKPVDIVNIFRRADDVPPIVDEAIAIGAKVVWMQLGVVNEDAAAVARAAGLEVVMDRCIHCV